MCRKMNTPHSECRMTDRKSIFRAFVICPQTNSNNMKTVSFLRFVRFRFGKIVLLRPNIRRTSIMLVFYHPVRTKKLAKPRMSEIFSVKHSFMSLCIPFYFSKLPEEYFYNQRKEFALPR